MSDQTNQATPSATDDPNQEAAVSVADEQPSEATEPQSGEAATAEGDGTPTEAQAIEAPSAEEAQPTAEPSDAAPAESQADAQPGTVSDASATEVAPLTEATATTPDTEAAAAAPDAQAADAISAVEASPEPSATDGAEAEEAAAAPSELEQAAVASEPMTMAELLDQPDHEVKSLKHGDVVEGTVVRIDPDEILVDFGGKSEGVVSNRELMSRRAPREGEDSRPEIKVGDEVLVYVLQPESPEGHAVLSLRRAGLERKWRAMQERFDAGEIVEARVIDHNKGGLIVDLGVRGFVPISQIVDFPRRPRDEQPRDAAQEIAEKLQPFVGRTLRLKILEVNRKANRLILSEKVALYEERREKRDELFSSLETGQRVTGVVRSIAPFGVFVDLGGIDGLVHKSELSWNKVNNPETAYQIGDEVEAEVIDINHERGRISLSIRRLQPDPWQESVAKYKIGDVIDGTVTKLVNFGAFVRVEEGLEGLIHISELSHQRVAHPGDVVQEGQQTKLRIISLDSERHRLGLSLKQAEDRPAPAPREERPRRDRGPRRERFDYRPEDATAEPEGGIDNTMAAAFAESGLLEQFRASQSQAEEATAEPAAEPAEAATAAEEPMTASTEEPATAEVETAEAPAAEEPATAEAVTTEAAATEEPTEAPVAESEAEPAAAAEEADEKA
ncbi:MAG TPA: 30S ribosomal protein S1 [Candidatus Limnocylindria bacterium]|nr:30S ribosomal protein S1 [Candidatus Limnocylindria bacterium]